MSRLNVTKTFLPPIEEYEEYLRSIWDEGQLTNQGPLLHRFENEVKSFLNVENFHFVGNGTLALQVALKALEIEEGEVITTPFTYVATTSSILWEKLRPVYVDINASTLCIDPKKIEAAITSQTKAIMPVHVFGAPCDIEEIDAIAKKHNLKVIYDGAHAFGATYKGKSLLDYGDISIGSFHSTKLFHTIEGGCLVVRDKSVSDKVELVKRFGHNGDDHYMLGINAKASEFQAAMGLCNLKYIQSNIAERRKVVDAYNEMLPATIKVPQIASTTDHNYGYYPVLFDTEAQALKTTSALNSANIFPRRYFYPSLNKLPYVDGVPCPISEDIASRIICLPLYAGLADEDVKKVSRLVQESLDA